jgi:cytochrome P450
MRLITPKRLKENEAFMWRLADQTFDEFFARGECEFIREYALPFTLLVVADLLGVPEDDRDTVRRQLVDKKRAEEMSHAPLEYLYAQFTAYIEDRRRAPREDVMTGLATATFPDGTLPDVDDVMRIAANLFSAGGETTARLLSTSFRILGDRADLQRALRDNPDKIPAFIEEALRLEPPIKGEFRLARVPVTVGGVDLHAGTVVFLMNGDPRQFENPHEFRLDRANGRHHIGFGHGIHSCVGAPLARAEARITIERFLARTRDIQISEAAHGPADARRYEYDPTYMLRGLRELHLEFTPIQ